MLSDSELSIFNYMQELKAMYIHGISALMSSVFYMQKCSSLEAGEAKVRLWQ